MIVMTREHTPRLSVHVSRSRRAEALIPADLTPITLGELNAQAAMMSRVDRKYVLNSHEIPEILSDLEPETLVLEIYGKRGQSYETTYFDTPELDAFYTSAHPRRRRFKVRTRTYVDSGLSFLEVKTRGGRGYTVKQRIPYEPADATAGILTSEGRAWVEEQLRHERCGVNIGWRLRPVLTGSYTRITLAMSDGRGRATLDTDLAWNADGKSFEATGMVIVETKSGASPSAIDRLLWNHGKRPTRISKYATALAALHPDMPRNRWTRVLRQHFDAQAV